mgnify:CR=1 FL=1
MRQKAKQGRGTTRIKRGAFAGAVLALALLASVAPLHAEPAFSAADQAIITRNASLRASFARDPASVRQALDLMARSRTRAVDLDKPGGLTRDVPIRRQDSVDFDASTDPDLGALQRASPEAAHDLFQLLKQASSGVKQPKTE